MFFNLALGCVFGVCMLQVVQKGLEHSTLPTVCAWVIEHQDSSNNNALPFIGTILVIGGNCLVFAAATWLLHDRRQFCFKWIQLAGIFTMITVAVAATVRIVQEAQAFSGSAAKTPLTGLGEMQWTYATLVQLLMLVLPLFTVLEIYRGEMHVKRDFEKQG